ncbi:MAG: protease SohB [Gammaproteobacteria bacterium]
MDAGIRDSSPTSIATRIDIMWIEFLTDYGMFLAKLATVVVLVGGTAAILFIFYMRMRAAGDERLEVRHLNEKYEHMQLMLRSAILPRKAFKQAVKELKAKHKEAEKAESGAKRRIFVLRFNGDIRASEVASLREEITALLTVASDGDEVVVILESAGGTVHGYGLAASQLRRIRDRSIRLTASVDKVAASGGYMMACVADRIIAAPFAVIGSIGVLAQLPNFNRFLKKHEIDFEELAAGKYKRTLSLFGENTDEDRAKLRQELEETHELFKGFVREHRPAVDMDRIATGEHWYGRKALELGLVDELRTSDDYLSAAARDANIYEVACVRKKSLWERLFPPAIN